MLASYILVTMEKDMKFGKIDDGSPLSWSPSECQGMSHV
jgi:hypothetical protein